MSLRIQFLCMHVVVGLICWPLVCPAAAGASETLNRLMANLSPEQFFEGSSLQLAKAVEAGNVQEVHRLANGVDLNRIHKRKMTMLFYALSVKQFPAMTELIKVGADPQQIDKDLGAPLDVAVQMDDSKALEAMLNGGVSPDATNSWGTPLLFTAACLNSLDSLRLLVSRKVNLDATDNNLGRTAASEAFSKLCYDQVEFLIEHGATVHVTLVNGVTLPYSLQRRLAQQKPGTPAFEKLTKIKQLMEDRGVKFPADPPSIVRAQIKAKGLKVAE